MSWSVRVESLSSFFPDRARAKLLEGTRSRARQPPQQRRACPAWM